MKKDGLLNKWCWDIWISVTKEMSLGPYLLPYAKINSKWIRDLNVRAETIKLLEGNIGGNLYDLGLGNGFLSMTPKA